MSLSESVWSSGDVLHSLVDTLRAIEFGALLVEIDTEAFALERVCMGGCMYTRHRFIHVHMYV